MIDEYSLDRTGWARFSDDRQLRYRLARAITPTGARSMAAGPPFATPDDELHPLRRIVFVMLNPSTADAFKPDRTVSKCCQFAQRWNGDILEVVNLFAFISPRPADLKRQAVRGTVQETAAILEACTGAAMVIAAWGNHGAIDDRHETVRARLAMHDVALHHLGLTGDGHPLHPLARGKAWIPLDTKPEPWG